MSRQSQIRSMRAQGYKWTAIAKLFGITRQMAHKIGTRKKTNWNEAKLDSYYKRRDGFEGVSQISEECHRLLTRGREPSADMERAEASRIRRACTQLRARHFEAMRER